MNFRFISIALSTILLSCIAPTITEAKLVTPKPTTVSILPFAHAAQAKPMSQDYCRRKLRGEAPDGNGANDNDWGRIWTYIETYGWGQPNHAPAQLSYAFVDHYYQPQPLQIFVLVTYVAQFGDRYGVWFECWRHNLVPTGYYQDDWYTWGMNS